MTKIYVGNKRVHLCLGELRADGLVEPLQCPLPAHLVRWWMVQRMTGIRPTCQMLPVQSYRNLSTLSCPLRLSTDAASGR